MKFIAGLAGLNAKQVERPAGSEILRLCKSGQIAEVWYFRVS